MQKILSHHVRIFFCRMTRFWETSRFTVIFLELQSSRWVMSFVVSDIVLLFIWSLCALSSINGKVYLSFCPKWLWFSSKGISSVSQCCVLCMEKDKLQKLKEHLMQVSFSFLERGYRMITLNRKTVLSNKHKPYSQMKSNREGRNFRFQDFLEWFRSGTFLFTLQQ